MFGQNLIRTLLWIVIQGLGWFCDNTFYLSLEIAKMDFMNLKYNDTYIIWDLWNKLMIFIVVAVVIRILVSIARLFIDPKKNAPKFSFAKKIIGVILILLMMNSLPYILQTLGKANTYLINNINYNLGLENNTPPSTIVLTAIGKGDKENRANIIEKEKKYNESDGTPKGNNHVIIEDDGSTTTFNKAGKNDELNKVNPNENSASNDKVAVHEDDGIISFAKISDINNAPLGGSYYWFPHTFMLLVVGVLMTMITLAIFGITLDLAKRWFELLALILGSFIPISALVSDEDATFNWFKTLMSLFVSNYMEVYLMVAVMLIVNAVSEANANPMISVMMMIGGLLFTLNGSQTLARLMGIETSGSTLQQLAHVSQVLRPITHGFGGTLHMASPVLKKGVQVAKDGVHLGIEKMGGVGVNDYGKFNTGINHSETFGGQSLSQRVINDLKSNQVMANALNNPNKSQGSNGSTVSGISAQNGENEARTNINTSYNTTDLYRPNSTLYNFSEKLHQGNNFSKGLGTIFDRTYENALRKAQLRKGIRR